MTNPRTHLQRIATLAVLATPVAAGLLLFDQSASSTAAWAGMVVATTAAATTRNTVARNTAARRPC